MNLLALAIGTVLGCGSYYTGSRASTTYRIRRHGTRLRARVTDVRSTPAGEGDAAEDTVRVRFEVPDGPAVEAVTSIPLRGPTGLEPGDEVEIAHLPRHPGKMVVLGYHAADGVPLLAYTSVLFAVMTVFFLWVGLTLG
ncbi:hypothetical protein GCM10009639_63070 [Kitasatospora putterlickiae]|uniref:DUF3592 domain-containing protein n=1 Tax=Kitasatospora putterlickiae TaxID=221725 RepID=A0ABN1YL14_9ACTN